MTKEELLKQLERPLGKKGVTEIARSLGHTPDAVKNLIDLTFHDNEVYSFRAAWVLESFFNYCQPALLFSLPYFIESYLKQENKSCQRHYTKIMQVIIENKRTIADLQNFNWGPVTEITFNWLTGTASPPAVQANCLDILFGLKDTDNWIAEELDAQIQFLLRTGSAAIQSRGRAVLRSMKVQAAAGCN